MADEDLAIDFATGAGLPLSEDDMREGIARFSRWMSRLNRINASFGWWVFTSTARNLLSSSLGMSVVRVFALENLARSGTPRLIRVSGTSAGERLAIERLLHAEHPKFARAMRRFMTAGASLWAACRAFAQLARIYSAFSRARVRPGSRKVDVVLFTYVHAPVRAGVDAYFGNLADMLRRQDGSLHVKLLAYVSAPYRKRLREMESIAGSPYVAALDYLRLSDYAAAAWSTLRRLARPGTLVTGDAGLDILEPLLQRALIRDVSHREYLATVLTARAAKRFVSECGVTRFIYLYESKAVERAILIALRELPTPPRLIAYQHTSVTPRHINLLLEPDERDSIPLPDRIVTLGEVTKAYLEENGRYPAGLLRVGCALRQQWPAQTTTKRVSGSAPRVLLALSSSRRELEAATAFMIAVKDRLPQLELGIRAHVEFPLSQLSASLRARVEEHAAELSASPLADNLRWCDIVAYVSSTVSVEALLWGRPVVKLTVDPVDADPLLGAPPLRWVAANPDEFVRIVADLSSLPERELDSGATAARDYANEYLKRPTAAAVDVFLAD